MELICSDIKSITRHVCLEGLFCDSRDSIKEQMVVLLLYICKGYKFGYVKISVGRRTKSFHREVNGER